MRVTRVLAGMVALVASCAMADWPQFMGPTGNGIAPAGEELPGKLAVKELWQMPVAEGFGGAAILEDKVYFQDRPGNALEVFYVLDLSTGKELWKVENETQPFGNKYGVTRSTPAVDKGMAFTIGVTGDLTAFDLQTKKTAWRKNIGRDFGARPGGWGFATSPVIHGDLLLVGTPGSPKSGVVALNKRTGAPVWASAAFGSSDSYTTPVVETIAGVEQALCWYKGEVAGVRLSDGKVIWRYPFPIRNGRPIPNPVYAGDGKVFLTNGYGQGCAFLQLTKKGDGFDVKELVKDERTASKVSNAVFHGGFIYTNASDQGGMLQCFTPDGTKKWESKERFGMGSMIVAGNKLLVMNGDNGTLNMIAADPEKFVSLGSAKVLETKNVWAAMALSKGKLVVRDQKTMKCLDVTVR